MVTSSSSTPSTIIVVDIAYVQMSHGLYLTDRRVDTGKQNAPNY